jgi:hypothetical protein
MPPDIVVRPAGVWNTRVPFHAYLKLFKDINRRYALSELSALKVKRSLTETGGDASVRSLFAPRSGRSRSHNPAERGPWMSYRRALGRQEDGSWTHPSVENVLNDLEGVRLLAREGTIVRIISVFESYLHCWALNFLLARLESEVEWTRQERRVASHMSPVHRPPVPLGVVATLRAFPEAISVLQELPPFFKDPVTRVPVRSRDDIGVSALEALEMWIALRNLLVHRDGWVSAHVATSHGDTWNKVFAEFGRLQPLRAGSALPMRHPMVASVALTVYRSCLALNELLMTASDNRRGNREVLLAKDGDGDAADLVLPLLMPGDHDASLRWITDTEYRERLVPALRIASLQTASSPSGVGQTRR